MPGWGRTAARPGWGAALRWRTPGVCCPTLITSDGEIYYMGAALTNDGRLFTPDGADYLQEWSFPDFTPVGGALHLGADINFPPGTFANESLLDHTLYFATGMVAADDGNFYAWVSNDIGEGQQVIARFDPDDLANPTVLYNNGPTDPSIGFLYNTGLHWHPSDPGNLYAILVDVDDASYPDYNDGVAWLFRVDLATGTRTDLIDLADAAGPGTDPGGPYVTDFYMQEWDRGFVFPLARSASNNSGNFIAYDVVSGTWDQAFLSTVDVSFGTIPHAGANGLGQLLAADWSGGYPPDILNALDFAAGGGFAPGFSTCDFRDQYGNYAFEQIWFAPPDRSAYYVTDTTSVWGLLCV